MFLPCYIPSPHNDYEPFPDKNYFMFIYIYKVVITVCLFVCPIINQHLMTDWSQILIEKSLEE